MVKLAREALTGNFNNEENTKNSLMQLLSVGTSAGGARPKAVINIDPATKEMTSGQRPEAGKESWLLKFDGVGLDKALGDSQKYGRIEYAYSLMARAAGINMPETRLLEENGRAHFMTRRFDRTQPEQADEVPKKIHMQSLCALWHVDFNMIGVNGYASLFNAIERLELGEAATVEAFRRMAFNCLAMNCDDHSKNFSFLMDENGVWKFSPAYDITFAYNSQSQWLSSHLMGVDGKFSDITSKDLVRFAEKWDIPYARVSLKKIKEAIASWPEFAQAAGLSKEVANTISEHFVV
jgi:serine/threonine-protein kinase HipA